MRIPDWPARRGSRSRAPLTEYAPVRAIACAVLGVLLLLSSADGLAEALLPGEIRAQPLAAALEDFAHQTGLQLVYLSDVLKGQESKGSRAGVPTAEALTALLEGTGLTFEFLNQRAVRIFPEPKQSESGEGPKPPVRRRVPAASELDEVDVYGQREERVRAFAAVQNVPASVSMVSGEFLQAQESAQLLDYATDVPGLDFVVGGGPPGMNTVFMRGIISGYGANSVAYYVDDTPIGGTGTQTGAGGLALDLMPYDVERLEVWRGPQGTSIGPESEIGLIRYALIQPNLTDLHTSTSAAVFTIRGAEKPGETIFGAVNLPIVSGQLAVRLSAFGNYTPGYIDNLYDGAQGINVVRRHGVRLAALWQPTAAFSATLNALSNQDAARGLSQVTYNRVGQVPNTGAAWFVEPLGSWGDLVDNAPLLSPASKRLDLCSLSLRWTPGAFELHSATSWSGTNNDNVTDDTEGWGPYYPVVSNGAVPAGLTFFSTNETLHKLSEELRVSSTSGRRLEWMLGAFYTRETGTADQLFQALDTAGQPISYFAPDLSYSTILNTFIDEVLFANATWHVTGRFDLGAGIRRAHDDQTQIYTPNGPPSTVSLHRSETDTSWMGSAKYRLSSSTTVYARVATGYQPGITPGSPQTMIGERTLDYDLGLKAAYLDSKALVDLTVFYVDQKDIEVAEAPAGAYVVTNGARAASKGFELTSSYAPIPDLELAYIADLTQAAVVSVAPYAAWLLTGYQIPNVPKWTMSASAAYSWPLAGFWHARIGGDIRWIGGMFATPFGAEGYVEGPPCCGDQPAQILPSYRVIDANAQVSRGPLRLRLYARNLTDERAFIGGNVITNGTTSLPFETLDRLLQPRTIGFGVDYSF